MLRFVVLGVPLLALFFALGATLQEVLGAGGDTAGLARMGLAAAGAAAARWRLAEWLLEAMALAALYLLAHGRCGRWWLDGLVAGGLGWVLRGPAMLMTIARLTRLPREPWVSMAQGWLVLYLAGGLLLALLARQLEIER